MTAVRRVVGLPLTVHAIALALVLLALLPVIGTSGQFSADEGAAIAQARQLERGDGWTVTDSFPAADPDGSAFPFELAVRGGDHGDQYAPFGKHLLYPAVLAVGYRVLGNVGMMLVSIAGAVAAALMSALIARRLRTGLAVPALWTTGLATPLLFDAYTVIAHTVGAALAAGSVYAVVRALDRGSRWWLGVIFVCVALATMLRTEMLLFTLGLSAATVIATRLRRSAWLVAAVPLVAAGVATLIDRQLLKAAVPGPQSTTKWLEQPSSGLLASRFSALKITWLLPAYDVDGRTSLLIGALVAAAIATWLARSRPAERDGIRVFAVVTAAAAVAWFFLAGGPVPGLLPALPLMVIALVAWDRTPLPRPAPLLVLTFALFSLGVLATEYASGGSGEWGGRYFALGIPMLVPVLWLLIGDLWRTLDRSTRLLVSGSVVVLLVALTGSAIITLRDSHRDVDVLARGIDATAAANAASDGGAPVVITTSGSAARLAYTVAERTRWLTVPVERLREYAERVRSLGVAPVTFVTNHRDEVDRIRDLYRDDATAEPLGGWFVITLRPR